MITEDYVSYEVAKLLKEKGFDESTSMVYMSGDLCKLNRYDSIRNSNYNDITKNYFEYTAPTHQMAMKWLREVHNIDIDIDAAVGMLGVKVYVPFISTYKPLKDAPSKVRQIKRGIYYKDDKGVIPALQHFAFYEEAVEAALKYSLENLI